MTDILLDHGIRQTDFRSRGMDSRLSNTQVIQLDEVSDLPLIVSELGEALE